MPTPFDAAFTDKGGSAFGTGVWPIGADYGITASPSTGVTVGYLTFCQDNTIMFLAVTGGVGDEQGLFYTGSTTPVAGVSNVGWITSSDRYVYCCTNTELVVVDSQPSTPVVVATLVPPSFHGFGPQFQVALSPDGTKVVVGYEDSATASSFALACYDTATNTLLWSTSVATVHLGSGNDLAWSTDSQRIFAMIEDAANVNQCALLMVDGSTGTQSRLSSPTGHKPVVETPILCTADGLYVLANTTGSGDSWLEQYDQSTGAFIQSLATANASANLGEIDPFQLTTDPVWQIGNDPVVGECLHQWNLASALDTPIAMPLVSGHQIFPTWMAVSKDQSTIYLVGEATGTPAIQFHYDIASGTFTIDGDSASAIYSYCKSALAAIPPPPTPTGFPVATLYIPIKQSMDAGDLNADWLAVENWANRVAAASVGSAVTVPTLFIPRKGLDSYDSDDFTINFLAIERWANGFMPQNKTLFVPRKAPHLTDLPDDWLAIQNWANDEAVPYLADP